MKILMILPEFEEGGVERHVLWLSSEISGAGNSVAIVTAGGKLESKLPSGVRVIHLPVHLKNPLTAIYSAARIAQMAKQENFDLIHAHSRVPSWIAWWVSLLAKKPWIVTAHDRYRKNKAIIPFQKADGAICVSEAVMHHLKRVLPPRSVVVRNGIPEPDDRWRGGGREGKVRFLFVGRLTRRKGLHVALAALAPMKERSWELDILGDGPQREELEAMVLEMDLQRHIRFHGFRDDVGAWMASSDCLLFPSFDEGMPLTLMQAIRIGTPVVASAIEPVRELVVGEGALVKAGDLPAWTKTLDSVISGRGGSVVFDPRLVPSVGEMAGKTLEFYVETIKESFHRMRTTQGKVLRE